MPADFRFHDLRHFIASLLIATYGHLWPDSDDSTRTAIAAVMAARADAGVDSLRTEGACYDAPPQVRGGAGSRCRSRARTPEGVLDTSGYLGETRSDLRKRIIWLSADAG